MAKSKLDQKRALTWRIAATAALVAAALYMLDLHRQAVALSIAAIRHASLPWVLLSLALMVLTLCIASASYAVLALRWLRMRDTLLIQLAASFAGRLLPAGLGGLGLNGVYLFRRGHTPAEATAVVSVNNLLGMCAHLLLLAGVVTVRPGVLQVALKHVDVRVPGLFACAVFGALCVAALVSPIRRRLVRFAVNLAQSVRKEPPHRLALALLLAGALTITYTLMLYASARSVGISVGLLQTFIVFSFGTIAGTATPTPGGLVGVEAGLVAGFALYGTAGVRAGAAVLAFRLVSYWLPLVPGAVALFAARRLRLL